MPIYRRLALLAVAMGWFVWGVDARADQDENLRRLRSMPLEQRRGLARNLERFDAMGAADREAIRAIDRELARRPDADRARYLAALRRYHLWLERLPGDKREAIAAVPPQERMAFVTRLRAEEHGPEARRRTPTFLQVVDLGDMSPFDVAQWLKIWFELTPSERERFERRPRAPGLWNERFRNSLDPNRKIELPQGQFTAQEEEALVRRMLKDHEFRFGLPGWISLMLNPPGRNFEPPREAEADTPEPKSEPRDRTSPPGRNGGPRMSFQSRRASLVHCLAGNYFWIENPPEKVEPSNLFRFLSALPKGISESITYLPPEEARRRLTILYRLLYPAPGEMPPSVSTSNPPGSPPTESTGKAEPPSTRPASAPPAAQPF